MLSEAWRIRRAFFISKFFKYSQMERPCEPDIFLYRPIYPGQNIL
jgi:hypothetical protein